MKRFLVLALLILAQAFPSSKKTTWMSPESFRLRVGMDRSSVVERLDTAGWTTREGSEPGHLIVDYDESRTMTLVFNDDRLTSIRFELVDFIPSIREAFEEQRKALVARLGDPTRSEGAVLIYDTTDPKVYVVVSTETSSSFGRQGLGFLSVRYFE